MLQAPAPHSFDIAWFSFIDEELRSALAALDSVYEDDAYEYKNRHGIIGDNNIYHLGTIGDFNVVLVRPPLGDGAANTASALADLTRSFRSLKYYLLAGVYANFPLPA